MEGAVFAATKLVVPALRPGLAARDGLVARLARPGTARLTLLSAAAGSGKTTLAAQWAAWPGETRRFAWLSLDPEDADPVRFVDGVISALAQVLPGIGKRARAAMRSPGAGLAGTVVPLLLNEVGARPEAVVLVLDDLHAVDHPDALKALTVLVERSPATLHVAVTTRRDPALPLARLRARGELAELRGRDLRFSDAEAAAMLHGLGLDVGAAQLEALQARTEGWAAGLQLAGLSLRDGTPGTAGAVPHADGYLGEEVLDAQDPATRAFLLGSSVLERLSGPLCDAVLATTGSAARLDDLAAAGLFLVPLDPEGTWFRFHHLFRETLRRRLERERPGSAAALDARAGAWFAAAGAPADAIRHAVAAGDGSAAGLIAGGWRGAFDRGELATVSGWLAALPADVVEDDTQLWLARAWVALDTGRLGAIPAVLAGAERRESRDRHAWAALLRAVHAFKRGDLGAAAAGVAGARAAAAEPSDFWRAVAAVISGAVAYWHGRDAERELRTALRTARGDDNGLAQVYALGYLSLAAGEAGDRDSAVGLLSEAEAVLARDPALGEHFVALTVQLARAAEAQRRGAPDAALRAAERALELARRGAGALEEAEALRVVALARGHAGDPAGARRALSEARGVAVTCPDPGRLAQRLAPGPAPVLRVQIPEHLSGREVEVLRLLATRLSQREIGAELDVSMNTVKTHVRNIFFKLRVGARDDAVGRARDLGIL